MFNFDQVDWHDALRSTTLQLQRFEHSPEATPFELALNLHRSPDGVQLIFDYPLESFDSVAIERLADAYLAAADQAADRPALLLRDLALDAPASAPALAARTAGTVPS